MKIPDYWTAFHEFAVEWTPTKLTFLVDQKPYKSYSDPAMLPVNEHFMMLNSAVGVAQGDTAILHWHWLPFLRDLHTNLAVVAVICSQNDSIAPG